MFLSCQLKRLWSSNLRSQGTLSIILGHRNKPPWWIRNNLVIARSSYSIPNKVLDFLKNEKDLLAKTLTASPTILFRSEGVDAKLDYAIQKQLDDMLDIHNKLVKLLSFHPSMVDSNFYLHLFSQLDSPLDSESFHLLLRRLTYHNNFSACWYVIMQNLSTLNDIEDAVDTMIKEVKNSNNYIFGVYHILLGSRMNPQSHNVFNNVFDLVMYKCKIDPNAILKSFQYLDHRNIQSPPRAISSLDNIYIHLIHCQSHILKYNENWTNGSSSDLNLLLKTEIDGKEFWAYSGWLHLLLILISSINPKLLMYLETTILSGSAVLNGPDFLIFLKKSPELDDAYKIYQAYTKFVSVVDRGILNELARRILGKSGTEELLSILSSQFDFLDSDIIQTILTRIYDQNSKELFNVCLLIISKYSYKDAAVLEEFMKFFKLKNNISVYSDFLDAIKDLELFENALKQTLGVIKNEKFKDGLESFFSDLGRFPKLLGRLYLEMFRTVLLHAELFEKSIIQNLYRGLLSSIWNVGKITQNRSKESTKVSHHYIYTISRKSDKSRLHNNLRALSQCISLIDESKISQIFNIFQNTELNFYDHKNYILNTIITETMNFIFRGDRSLKSVATIRSILSQLQFQSITTKSLSYKFEVMEDPQVSFRLLDDYVDKKSALSNDVLTSISLGILYSNKIEKSERLVVFKKFRSTLKQLGYHNRICTKETIELMNLLLEVAELNPNINLGEVRSFINVNKKTALPQKIIKRWNKKVNLILKKRNSLVYR